MQLKNIKTRVTKMKLSKCGVCRVYSDIAYRYALELEENEAVDSFVCNVELEGVFIGSEPKAYTTDFYITYFDGTEGVRECIARDKIRKPKNIKLLDASKEYWEAKGIKNWGIVINKEEQTSEILCQHQCFP